jgi:hypothetical protein
MSDSDTDSEYDNSFVCELCSEDVFLDKDEEKRQRCVCGALCCEDCMVGRGSSRKGTRHHFSACELAAEYEEHIKSLKEDYERTIKRLHDDHKDAINILQKENAIEVKILQDCLRIQKEHTASIVELLRPK